MAIKDASVTIKGDAARVAQVHMYPQPNGNVEIVVTGSAQDSEGRILTLKEVQIGYKPGPEDAMHTLLSLCLGALRRLNGLEDDVPDSKVNPIGP